MTAPSLIDRFEAVLAEATRGPWKASSFGAHCIVRFDDDVELEVANFEHNADAALIVFARNEGPKIVERMRALEAVADYARTFADWTASTSEDDDRRQWLVDALAALEKTEGT